MIKKKIVWLPYDFDTAIGINNEGQLVFSYNLEDIDHLEGGADVFNGQQSVVWKNVRAAFSEELAQMYKELRSTGVLSYEKVEKMFEDHQAKWSEAIFNEDSWFKYINPLVESGTGAYLPMMQGSKEAQRKWWLYNRFRYIDSKYNAGDALSDLIQIRGYAKANITVTPYADIYPSVKYGSYLVQTRGQRNVASTLVCPLDNVNDTEIYIYSASQLASVGDLSGFKVGFADFSMGTKLQAIKIGDASSSYNNGNLTSLTLGNNVLLKTLDVRNCSALGTGDQKAVDISGCEIIENVYFDGTAITGVTLPNGGVLKVLHLPATITNLTIQNHSAITDLMVAGYSNITTLRLENVPTVNSKAIFNAVSSGTRVRLIGFTWECQNATEIEALLNRLDAMRGLDESGNNTEKAQVSGTIHTSALTGAQIASYNARYPYLTVTADHVTSYLTYASYDGTTTYKTVTCLDGVPQDTAPANPTREPTAANTFTFVGWSKSMNSTTADADAQTDVIADRTIYAAYTAQARTYTVRFYNGSTLLETDTGVPYGGSTTYDGTTPVSPDGSAEDYPFEGWKPAPTNIQGDTSCYAQFGSPVEDVEITDSWDTIIASIDAGTYATKYKIGNYKPLDLGTEGTINMQIVAFDADELASGGYAPVTFVGKEVIKKYYFGDTWENSWLRNTFLNSTLFDLISQNVKTRIQTVNKYTKQTSGDTAATQEKIWIPSRRETVNTGESEGCAYKIFTNSTDNRKKQGSIGTWWLRSNDAGLSNIHNVIQYDGKLSTLDGSNYQAGIAIGFCLGLEPETITDTWAEIFEAESDGTYSTKYSIGDTKMIDLGTEGKQLMEIVAFDTDDKAD